MLKLLAFAILAYINFRILRRWWRQALGIYTQWRPEKTKIFHAGQQHSRHNEQIIDICSLCGQVEGPRHRCRSEAKR